MVFMNDRYFLKASNDKSCTVIKQNGSAGLTDVSPEKLELPSDGKNIPAFLDKARDIIDRDRFSTVKDYKRCADVLNALEAFGIKAHVWKEKDRVIFSKEAWHYTGNCQEIDSDEYLINMFENMKKYEIANLCKKYGLSESTLDEWKDETDKQDRYSLSIKEVFDTVQAVKKISFNSAATVWDYKLKLDSLESKQWVCDCLSKGKDETDAEK